jgi:hypothetical protein
MVLSEGLRVFQLLFRMTLRFMAYRTVEDFCESTQGLGLGFGEHQVLLLVAIRERLAPCSWTLPCFFLLQEETSIMATGNEGRDESSPLLPSSNYGSVLPIKSGTEEYAYSDGDVASVPSSRGSLVSSIRELSRRINSAVAYHTGECLSRQDTAAKSCDLFMACSFLFII